MITDTAFFKLAHEVAAFGTCSRLKVGALIVRDNRIILSGYNGTAHGLDHCNHNDTKPCHKSVHAEANTIAAGARFGVSTADTTLYVTHMPCEYCAGLIINAGISHVKYELPYRNTTGIKALSIAGISVMGFEHGTD